MGNLPSPASNNASETALNLSSIIECELSDFFFTYTLLGVPNYIALAESHCSNILNGGNERQCYFIYSAFWHILKDQDYVAKLCKKGYQNSLAEAPCSSPRQRQARTQTC